MSLRRNQKVLEDLERIARGGDDDGVEFLKGLVAIMRQLCMLQASNLALEKENEKLKERLVSVSEP